MSDQLAILRPAGAELAKLPAPIRVLGIDLGTTNSTVAEVIWNPRESTVIPVRCLEIDQPTASGVYTHLLVPSAVAIQGGKVVIGEGAKRMQSRAVEFGLEREKSLFLECKNDIGALKTYHRAPEGFRSAAEIGGKLLGFLKQAALEADSTPIARIAVTVPASFQAAQRLDTVKAAELAGISITGGDLLDEPVAAFLDYLMSHPDEIGDRLSVGKKLVVFDFGGGTCDVAVFRLDKAQGAQCLKISPLAVSRYHRLGGGDIDRAIVYEVLLPQLLRQNELEAFDLSFEDKKNFIEPAYVGVAEALKTGLCYEIARLESFGQYAETDKTQIVKRQPGLHQCRLKDRVLDLQSPSLTAAQFEEMLKPFLDHDLLYARETEYRLTCSILAPIQDALERAQLTAAEIDLCLLVGGSSLIPQVTKAVASFFPKANLLRHSSAESLQVAVARGAAYHALALALYGQSIFKLVTPDRIAIGTTSGFYQLVPQGATLPFPNANGWAEAADLTVPASSLTGTVELIVEIVAGDKGAERSLLNTTWAIRGPVKKGDPLHLQFRIDENQVFHFRLTLAEDPSASPFIGHIENPLSNVVNPHAKRLLIQQMEEDLRTGKIPQRKIPDSVVEIARNYAELQQIEKAISYLRRALQMKNGPDAYILNLLGIYHGELGDFEKQEKFYREAAVANTHDAAPLFNLSLSQYRRKLYPKALVTVDEALKRANEGPSLTLKAQISDALGKPEAMRESLSQALVQFGSGKKSELKQFSDWELGWYLTACRLANDEDRMSAAAQEQKRRRSKTSEETSASGLHPMLAPAIVPK